MKKDEEDIKSKIAQKQLEFLTAGSIEKHLISHRFHTTHRNATPPRPKGFITLDLDENTEISLEQSIRDKIRKVRDSITDKTNIPELIKETSNELECDIVLYDMNKIISSINKFSLGSDDIQHQRFLIELKKRLNEIRLDKKALLELKDQLNDIHNQLKQTMPFFQHLIHEFRSTTFFTFLWYWWGYSKSLMIERTLTQVPLEDRCARAFEAAQKTPEIKQVLLALNLRRWSMVSFADQMNQTELPSENEKTTRSYDAFQTHLKK